VRTSGNVKEDREHPSKQRLPNLNVSAFSDRSLSLKTRFIRNVTQDTMQDELVLNFKPVKSKNNLEIELSATNQYTDTANIKQRVWLSTSFKI